VRSLARRGRGCAAAGGKRTRTYHVHVLAPPSHRPSRKKSRPHRRFYRRALQVLADAGVPFLVGGAFAHACFTGIRRSTKDLDLFIKREDYERVAALMQAKGWRTEMTYPHWLAKVYAARTSST
jgi:hypothetical protein